MLDPCTKAYSTGFNKARVLHIDHKNLMQHYKMGAEWLEGGPAEKDLGCWLTLG